ncbi:MAG: hypothetical protein JKY08_06195 [Flavobacteriaceae bacterium]|nr:hypothetical protein [Flavobacteriaceae bacterium]
MLKISIPFKIEFTLQTAVLGDTSVCYVDIEECSRRGISLEAKTVNFTSLISVEEANGVFDKYEISDLRHPYQSLPTSHTGMAFKIFQGTPNRDACVELKASPAKIIQGHNVYGSTSIELGSQEMLAALWHVLPDFYEMLDVPNTLLDLLDATYSARVRNENLVKQVIQQLKNVSNKQMRTSVRNDHETTCYFSRGSRHVDRKVYGKGFEFNNQLNEMRSKVEKGNLAYQKIVDVMSDPELINFARNLIRLEASAKRRYLDEFGIPKKLFDAWEFQKNYESDGKNLIADIWVKAFAPLLDALKGQKMNIFNDIEVYDKLKAVYSKTTPKGNITYSKADRVFRFYRSLLSDGYENVKSSFSVTKTFYNRLNLLLQAGFSKAQVQNLKGNGMDNVIPLLQVIEIDFSSQRPSNWVEPTLPIFNAYETGDLELISNVVNLKVA